jgi:predicted DNA-binding transcriptional regulator YafY
MARNAELIRQWEILREIDSATNGVAVARLASQLDVHQRTVRRDVEALCKAGFPLYDDKVNGTTMWKLRARPFRALEDTGLGLTELCALYFCRTMVMGLGGGAFQDDVDRALDKIERALPTSCRQFLDRLPTLVKAKATGRKKHDERKAREFLARAADAALNRRRALMTYFSSSSRRVKEYTIEPIRVAYADGGIYLTAWVPEYCEVRTFALERIRTLQLLDERFEPRALPLEPFANSLGVHSGTPEHIEIEFDARVADYVREREWHRSMSIEDLPDGFLLARLTVCDDRPLRRWIHSFGSAARVVAPARLAQAIFEEIEDARDRYKPRLMFDVPRMALPPADQPMLPAKYRGWKAS